MVIFCMVNNLAESAVCPRNHEVFPTSIISAFIDVFWFIFVKVKKLAFFGSMTLRSISIYLKVKNKIDRFSCRNF